MAFKRALQNRNILKEKQQIFDTVFSVKRDEIYYPTYVVVTTNTHFKSQIILIAHYFLTDHNLLRRNKDS